MWSLRQKVPQRIIWTGVKDFLDKVCIVHKFLYWSNLVGIKFSFLKKPSTFNGETLRNSADQEKPRYFNSNSWVLWKFPIFYWIEDHVFFFGKTSEDLDLSVCVYTYTDTYLYTHTYINTHIYTYGLSMYTELKAHDLKSFYLSTGDSLDVDYWDIQYNHIQMYSQHLREIFTCTISCKENPFKMLDAINKLPFQASLRRALASRSSPWGCWLMGHFTTHCCL